MFLKVKDLEFLDSGDLKVTISRAKNFELFNAKSSFIAANPEGRINFVDLLKKFLALRKGSLEDFVFATFRELKGRVVWLDQHVREDVARKYLKMGLASAGVEVRSHLSSPCIRSRLGRFQRPGTLVSPLRQKLIATLDGP